MQVNMQADMHKRQAFDACRITRMLENRTDTLQQRTKPQAEQVSNALAPVSLDMHMNRSKARER